MKLSALLIAVVSLQTIGNSFSQVSDVTLHVKNEPIVQVFQELEKQSNLHFLYINETVKNKTVTLSVEKSNIETVLNKILSTVNMKYTILENNLVVVTPGESRQGILIKGKITDAETGEPLPGVNVVEKGTTTGTVTDVNGEYSLEVSGPDAVLLFSYVGYNTTEMAVSGQTEISFGLQPTLSELDEVVVIGYGTMKKNDLTGSVGSVSSDDLVSKGTTTIMGALQGTIPGVNITNNSARPGGDFKIQIRGQNSMFDGQPLYVVDGVVTEDIEFLNPSDIERIDILKDASSTAIFGSRGSNGVVLVQTKSAGAVKTSKVTVNYDGYFGIRELARIPEFMDGREWIDFRSSAYYSWNNAEGHYEMTPTNQNAVLNGSTVLSQRLYDEDYEDWLDLATRTGQQQNHYLNISGGSNDISYHIGMGYQNEEGNLIHESFDRYSTKLSIDHKPNKYFQAGATAMFAQTGFDKGSEFGYRDIMRISPILHAYDAEGNLIPQPGIRTVIQGTGNFTSSTNPLLEIESGNQETRRQDLVSSLYAQVNFFKSFSFRSTISPRFNRTRFGEYFGVVPNNRSIDYASVENSETFDYTWDNQLSFNKTMNLHSVNATLINSVYRSRYESAAIAAENLPYKSYWYNMSVAERIISDESPSSYSQVSLLSFAGRLNYDYAGKYLATATLRYDGSSKLADKWAAFPSFAVAWRLSQEKFMDFNWLSNLKLRFSYGFSGNNNGVDPYGTIPGPVTKPVAAYDFNGNVVTGFFPGPPVNIALTWEKTREIDFGLDFGVIKGRVFGTFDIYDKLSDNLILSRRLAIESGVHSMIDNVGSVSNKGIELSLTTVNFRTANFQWMTSFNYSRNKNAIVSLFGKKEDIVGEEWFIGEPINVIYDYKILGVWTQAEYDAGLTTIGDYTARAGEAKTWDASGDGNLGNEDKVILGSPDPEWIGSFTSTLQFKNIDFSFNIYTKQGVFLLDYFTDQYGYNTQRGMAKVKFDYYIPPDVPTIDWNNFSVDENGNAIVQWTTTGTGNEDAKYPIYRNANGAYYGTNGNYQDASFVKVKNITLGYTFSNNLVKKLRMSRLRIYANVLNPFTFTDYVGWDPEYAATEMIDGNGPSNITYQFGINAQF